MIALLLLAPPSPPPATRQLLEVSVLNGLQFGGLPVEASGGSVVLTADDQLLALGSGIRTGASPPARSARFILVGPPGQPYTVTVSPQNPTLSGSGTPIRISEWISAPEGFRGTFDSSGRAEFRMGARADIPTNPVAGQYVSAPVQLSVTSGSQTAHCTFDTSFIIRMPLVLSALETLDFGELIAGTQGGTMRLDPNQRWDFGGAQGLALFRGNPRPASFNLQGPAGTQFNITLPNRLILAGPGAPLAVTGFTTDSPLTGILPPGGLRFRVGGTLEVAPHAAPGLYKGTFQVTIAYQ